jgi:RNA recognition motif-containing protein
MKIYLSNLPAGTSNAGLAKQFQPFGAVTSAPVATPGVSARCRGYGFVEMMRQNGEPAISKPNDRLTDGVVPRVDEARART